MGRLLVIVFVVVPLVEIYVLLQVGHIIGTLPAVGLLLLISVLGAAVVRREGARAWRRFTGAVGAGQVPAREAADGVLVLVGGTLLLTPGYVTDLMGLLLVLPPTRALLRPALSAWLARRVVSAGPLGGLGRPRRPDGRRSDGPGPFGRPADAGGPSGTANGGRSPFGTTNDGTTIEGTVVDDEPDEPR